jgi:hypothetical protein
MAAHTWGGRRREALSRIHARKKAEQVQQVRTDRAAKKAGTYGLTRFEVIMREQLAARVAAETAERLRAMASDEPPPAPERPPGEFTKLFKGKLT